MPSSQANKKVIHFSGICGTGMASLAVLLKMRGHRVHGSDENIYPPMSDFLAQNKIAVQSGFSAKNLETLPDLVVIGNALSRGNLEVEAVLESKLPYISMAELLKEYFIRGKTSIVVTGTHGKTTTSTLLSWVFESARKKPGFMIGGIAENFGSSCHDGAGDVFITEGDEYDTAFFDKRSKFLHYLPDQLILNNLEFDHADIFDSLEDIKKSFRLLLRLIPKNGLIVANGDDDNVKDVLKSAFSNVIKFGIGEASDVRAVDIEASESGTTFVLCNKIQKNYPDSQKFGLKLSGAYNLMNALGVIVIARHNGISDKQIQAAFDSFKSVRRRQELRGEVNGIAVYDDFAHHPTAIRETISAIRQKHPGRRLIAVFEPRSNTSVLKLHQKALIDSFSEADEVILTELHRVEKIPPRERLDIKMVLKTLIKKNISAYEFPEVIEIIEHLKVNCCSGDVVIIMSNGKFDDIHQRFLEEL
ncbi:MAG: UDP-N-acetylmuramate:L-alanyl-gamma-D-glutamyl-meso-diaminopimelate ligase [SAR324 cluster bacterium]|nr:UDP-N-acetylmuramate:L-alanyl-gamma-D-glutamyl-meso-diaminopimelate ligase [SAR324 cluster bacterium]